MDEIEIWLEGTKKLKDKVGNLCVEFIMTCWNR